MWPFKKKKYRHKWRVPLMLNLKSSFNPTECIKCGEMIHNILDYTPNKNKKTMKKIKNTIGLILMYLGAWLQGMKYVLIAALILSVIFTSCKTSGYGCKGKESWNGMVKRINKQ